MENKKKLSSICYPLLIAVELCAVRDDLSPQEDSVAISETHEGVSESTKE